MATAGLVTHKKPAFGRTSAPPTQRETRPREARPQVNLTHNLGYTTKPPRAPPPQPFDAAAPKDAAPIDATAASINATAALLDAAAPLDAAVALCSSEPCFFVTATDKRQDATVLPTRPRLMKNALRRHRVSY